MFYQTACVSLCCVRKFIVTFQTIICVFLGFTTFISICKSKQRGITTRRSNFRIANVWRWRFLGFHTPFKGKPKGESKGAEKIVFYQIACVSLCCVRKFIVTSQTIICVFLGFTTIIPMCESKRRGLTTRRSNFRIRNVRRWRFLGFHTPSDGQVKDEISCILHSFPNSKIANFRGL